MRRDVLDPEGDARTTQIAQTPRVGMDKFVEKLCRAAGEEILKKAHQVVGANSFLYLFPGTTAALPVHFRIRNVRRAVLGLCA